MSSKGDHLNFNAMIMSIAAISCNLKYFNLIRISWFVSPAAEIDHVSSLFQEKQAELQSAVVRVDQVTWRVDWGFIITVKIKQNWVCGGRVVKFFLNDSDQLTQQLEDLRRGRLQLHSVAPGQGAPTGSQGAPPGQKGSSLSGPAALELRKLYQELQVN